MTTRSHDLAEIDGSTHALPHIEVSSDGLPTAPVPSKASLPAPSLSIKIPAIHSPVNELMDSLPNHGKPTCLPPVIHPAELDNEGDIGETKGQRNDNEPATPKPCLPPTETKPESGSESPHTTLANDGNGTDTVHQHDDTTKDTRQGSKNASCTNSSPSARPVSPTSPNGLMGLMQRGGLPSPRNVAAPLSPLVVSPPSLSRSPTNSQQSNSSGGQTAFSWAQSTTKATSPSLTSPSPRAIHHDAPLHKTLSSPPQNLRHQRHLSFHQSVSNQIAPEGPLSLSPYHNEVAGGAPTRKRSTSAPLLDPTGYPQGKEQYGPTAYAYPPIVFDASHPTNAYSHTQQPFSPYHAAGFSPVMAEGGMYQNSQVYPLQPSQGWQDEQEMASAAWNRHGRDEFLVPHGNNGMPSTHRNHLHSYRQGASFHRNHHVTSMKSVSRPSKPGKGHMLCERIPVPNECLGALIGRKGVTRSRLQVESGVANITIITSSSEVVLSSRQANNIETAKRLISEVIAEFRVQQQRRRPSTQQQSHGNGSVTNSYTHSSSRHTHRSKHSGGKKSQLQQEEFGTPTSSKQPRREFVSRERVKGNGIPAV